MYDQVNRQPDRFPHACVWQSDVGREDAVREPRESLLGRICVNRADSALMSRIQRLQQIKRFWAPNFADDDPIGPMSQRCADEIRDRDCR